MSETCTAPPRVVAVTNGGSKRGFAYVTAAVYELRPRKDGVETYRRSDVRYAWPHRSVRLATQDAEELADRLGIPFWPDVRQHMTADEAIRAHVS